VLGWIATLPSLRGAAFSREELATWRDVAIAMTLFCHCEARSAVATHVLVQLLMDCFVPRNDRSGTMTVQPSSRGTKRSMR
jgi:hypothetical protein